MPRFEPILKVASDLCLRSGDILMRNRGVYLNCAKDVWNDLNEDSLKIFDRIKIPLRHKFKVNKKTNSIELPCDFLRLCSVNVIGKDGVLHPVWMNDRVHDDIVDISKTKDCACEFKCGYALCNTIKGYEAITSTKTDNLPNGSDISFTCVDRKYVDPNGFVYLETQYPIRVYTNGTWTDTVLKTDTQKLCECEVDKNGCICDTEKNLEVLCNSCGIKQNSIPFGGDAQSFNGNPNVDTWKYFCSSKLEWFGTQCGNHSWHNQFNNVYNLNELGNRIVLPHNFPFDNVVIRYFADIQLRDLQIPYMAKECFMDGLQWLANTHKEDKQQIALVYQKKYTDKKWGLLQELNKYRIAELKMITTPPIWMPSFIEERHAHGWGGDIW